MLLNGANGITQEELKTSLNIEGNATLDAINADLKKLLESIAAKNKTEVTVSLANRILVSNDYTLLDNFQNKIRDNFNASVDSVDFSMNALNITEEINNWAKEQTNGKIDKLFDDLSNDTALVLANAIYFKSNWSTPFDPYLTAEDNFFKNGNNESSKVVMMKSRLKYKYITCPQINSSLIELPFSRNSNVSMIIILPDLINGLNNVTNILTLETLNRGIAEINSQPPKQLELSLPKFALKNKYNLKNPLKTLGMNSLFETSADLSGINGHRNLLVSKAVHKAVITVTENGCEASAVTGIAATPHIWIPPTVVKVDRPFIFLIKDNSTGLILFLGQVREP